MNQIFINSMHCSPSLMIKKMDAQAAQIESDSIVKNRLKLHEFAIESKFCKKIFGLNQSIDSSDRGPKTSPPKRLLANCRRPANERPKAIKAQASHRKIFQNKKRRFKSKAKISVSRLETTKKKQYNTHKIIKSQMPPFEDSRVKRALNFSSGNYSFIRRQRPLTRHIQRIKSGLRGCRPGAAAHQGKGMRMERPMNLKIKNVTSGTKSKFSADVKGFRYSFSNIYQRCNFRKTVSKANMKKFARTSQLANLKKIKTEGIPFSEQSKVKIMFSQKIKFTKNDPPSPPPEDSTQSLTSELSRASVRPNLSAPNEVNASRDELQKSSLSQSQTPSQSSFVNSSNISRQDRHFAAILQFSKMRSKPRVSDAEDSEGFDMSCEEHRVTFPINQQHDDASRASRKTENVPNAILNSGSRRSRSRSIDRAPSKLESKFERRENAQCVDSISRYENDQTYIDIRSNTIGISGSGNVLPLLGDRTSQSLDRGRLLSHELENEGFQEDSALSTIAKPKALRENSSDSKGSLRKFVKRISESVSLDEYGLSMLNSENSLDFLVSNTRSNASNLRLLGQKKIPSPTARYNPTQLSEPFTPWKKRLMREIIESNQNALNKALDEMTKQNQANMRSLCRLIENKKSKQARADRYEGASGLPGAMFDSGSSVDRNEMRIDELRQRIERLQATNSDQAQTIVKIRTQMESQKEFLSFRERGLHQAAQKELQWIRQSLVQALEQNEALYEQQQSQIKRLDEKLRLQSKVDIELTRKIAKLEWITRQLDFSNELGLSRLSRSEGSHARGKLCEGVENGDNSDSENQAFESLRDVSDRIGQLGPRFLERSRQKSAEIVLHSSVLLKQNSKSLFFSQTRRKYTETRNRENKAHCSEHQSQQSQSTDRKFRKMSYRSAPASGAELSLTETDNSETSAYAPINFFSFKPSSLNLTTSEHNFYDQPLTTPKACTRFVRLDSDQAMDVVDLQSTSRRVGEHRPIEVEHVLSVLKRVYRPPSQLEQWPSFSGSTPEFFCPETLDFESFKKPSQCDNCAGFSRTLTGQFGSSDQGCPGPISQDYNVDYSENVFLDSQSFFKTRRAHRDLTRQDRRLDCGPDLPDRARDEALGDCVEHLGPSGESSKILDYQAMCTDAGIGTSQVDTEIPKTADYADPTVFDRLAISQISHEKCPEREAQDEAKIAEAHENHDRNYIQKFSVKSIDIARLESTPSGCLNKQSNSPVLGGHSDQNAIEVAQANKKSPKTQPDLHLLTGIALEKDVNRKLLDFIANHDHVSVSSFGSNSQLSDTLSGETPSELSELRPNARAKAGVVVEPHLGSAGDGQTQSGDGKHEAQPKALDSQPERLQKSLEKTDSALAEQDQQFGDRPVKDQTNANSDSEKKSNFMKKKNSIFEKKILDLATKNDDFLSALNLNFLIEKYGNKNRRNRRYKKNLSLTDKDIQDKKSGDALQRSKSLTRLEINLSNCSRISNLNCEFDFSRKKNIDEQSKLEFPNMKNTILIGQEPFKENTHFVQSNDDIKLDFDQSK